MKQDMHSVISERRSCRRFTDKKITRDDLHLLIEYGMKAPSAANLQDYRFISVLDRQKIKALPDACMEQDWISHAGGVIVVVSQPQLIKEYFPEQGERMATQSASAAVQNILLAAHAHGFGACWVSGLSQADVKELFAIPESASVEAIIAIGHPWAKPDTKTTESFENLVYLETFGNDKLDKELINKEYSVKIERKAKELQRVNYEQKLKDLHGKVKEFFFKK